MNVIREQFRRASDLIWLESSKVYRRPWQKWLVRWLRVGYLVTQDLSEGQLTLRAMSLVYTTLLSLVPLLALSFSVLKGFGVHNQIQPMLLNLLQPLGSKGSEISQQIIGFVDNVQVGVLGTLGLGLLIYTVVALMQKIEGSFNFVWHVTQHRSIAQRFSDYLSVIIIGPVLVFSALGVTASLMSTTIVQRLALIEPFGTLIAEITNLIPYLMIIGAFAFIYGFIPNAKVKVKSALIGAVIAGIAWQSTGWGFASFVANSAKYTAIYSAFASLIMFMIWLYLSWLILLVGASIAFYHQHPEYLLIPNRQVQLSNQLKEWLALSSMRHIGRKYYQRSPGFSLEELAQALRFPTHYVESIVAVLTSRGLLTQSGEEPPRLLPAQPLDATPLTELIHAIRKSDHDEAMMNQTGNDEIIATELMQKVEQSTADVLDGITVKDLVFLTKPIHEDTQTKEKITVSLGKKP